MTGELLIRLTRETLYLALALAAPLVLAALVISMLVGLVQAATQIPDATIGFVPRAASVALALALAGPWIGAQLVRFAQVVLELIVTVT